jgi:hypothetical protein
MPLRSGGALANENISTRRLVGLISVGAKPCPSGEQIVNGGFETGDLTGWTTDYFEVDWSVPYEGFYHAWLPRTYSPTPITGHLEQIFTNAIPVGCFKASSLFQVAVLLHGACVPYYIGQVEVLYTDGTSTIVDLSGLELGVWHVIDLKSVLEPGKVVKGIKFTCTQAYDSAWSVDACTCMI